MRRFGKIGCLVLILAGSTIAARPIGTLFGEGPVWVNGIEMDVPGVVSWAVFDGDEVSTTSWPAAILLANRRGRIFLRETTKLKVGSAAFRVSKGKAFFESSGPQAWAVEAAGRTVALPAGSRSAIGIDAGRPEVKSGVPFPAVDIPADRLVRRLPYVLGLYLPVAP